MPKHTPGPWRIVSIAGKHAATRRSLVGNNGRTILELPMFDDECEANARLMAAAETIRALTKDYDLIDSYVAAQSAIAKATGQ